MSQSKDKKFPQNGVLRRVAEDEDSLSPIESDSESAPDVEGGQIMELEATFAGGVLRPTQPLDLRENEVVTLTVKRHYKLTDIIGMAKWTGDPEILRKLAEEDEFGIMESP